MAEMMAHSLKTEEMEIILLKKNSVLKILTSHLLVNLISSQVLDCSKFWM